MSLKRLRRACGLAKPEQSRNLERRGKKPCKSVPSYATFFGVLGIVLGVPDSDVSLKFSVFRVLG
jgi:hypothetical protein